MIKKILLYILLILWMSLIFFFSHQPATDSDKVSNGVIDKIIHTVEVIRGQEFNDKELEIISNYLIFPIRKLAHFTLYFILGILIYSIINLYNIDNKRKMLLSILFCIIYACSDEIHQLFVLGRSGELRDVLIDSIGSILGIIIISKILSIKRKKKLII